MGTGEVFTGSVAWVCSAGGRELVVWVLVLVRQLPPTQPPWLSPAALSQLWGRHHAGSGHRVHRMLVLSVHRLALSLMIQATPFMPGK